MHCTPAGIQVSKLLMLRQTVACPLLLPEQRHQRLPNAVTDEGLGSGVRMNAIRLHQVPLGTDTVYQRRQQRYITFTGELMVNVLELFRVSGTIVRW